MPKCHMGVYVWQATDNQDKSRLRMRAPYKPSDKV